LRTLRELSRSGHAPTLAWFIFRSGARAQDGASQENGRMSGLFKGLMAAAFAAALLPAAAGAGDAPAATEPQALHVLDRLGYGPAPGDLDRVMRTGVAAYVAEQLHPESLPIPPALQARLDAMPSLRESSAQLFAEAGPPARKAAGDDQAALDRVKDLQNRTADEAQAARLLRAIYSPAQLQEVMVDFWFNHFNVFIGKGQEDRIWTGAYERDAIRPYAMGRFRDLLFATATHPAMLYYLDNWQSQADGTDGQGKPHGLNENYAREVMELHTLGVDGGYTQKDVTELARILTGWTFKPKDLEQGIEPAFQFAPKRHDYGAKTFLGQSFPAGHGMEEGEQALDMLADSPATARHIAYQLAQYFVADDPPPALVQRLARSFHTSGGDIRQTLAVLFASPEFLDARDSGAKFKTPYQYVVSSVRAAGLPMIVNPRPLLGTLNNEGEPLYGCQTPDGYKNAQAAWLNPDAMILRLNFATALGQGRLPLWKLPDAPAAAMTAETPKPAPPPAPPDPFAMQAALGNTFSLNTAEALAAAQPALRAGLMLGSPEFMHY
jgi:uncharacterized protein (DUF1800 family)